MALLWALGVWDRYFVERQLAPAVTGVRSAGSPGATPPALRAAVPLRAGLVVMTAGMAYMLLAM